MSTKIGKIIFSTIAIITGIAAIVILLITVRTNRRSESELESIDAVIASYESTTAETTTTIETETTTAKVVKETTQETTTASVEKLAEVVLNSGLNGDERKVYLGNRYEEVQGWIDANYEPPTVAYAEPEYHGSVLTPESGVNYYNGVMETYYNMDMTPWLEFIYSLGYEGEYWVRSDGVKMFGDYIIVAADYSYEPRGTIVETSLGTGMVLDTGEGGWAWHDIAVAWGD